MKKLLTEPRKCEAIQYGSVVELSGSKLFALSMVGGRLDCSCFLENELWLAGIAFRNGRLVRSHIQNEVSLHVHVISGSWSRRGQQGVISLELREGPFMEGVV